MELWTQMMREGPGGIIWSAMTDLFEFPENYIKKMSNHAKHVDQLSISCPASWRFVWLRGEKSGEFHLCGNCGILWANKIWWWPYHYQAIEPVSNGPALQNVRE